MGQTLSEPVTEKHTIDGEDDSLLYACSEMQGWRISMEDAHATILNLDGKTDDEKASFFAVYDGHGGSTVAEFSGQTVHTRLAATDEYKQGNYEAALKRAFLGTDEDLRASPEYASDPSGCTAVAALLVAGPPPVPAAATADVDKAQGQQQKVARRIIVANAGDSRSVLSVKGEAKPMSFDHKPGNKDENARIVGAGGFVEFGRVNGNLALSRAIGDFEFKQNTSLSAEAQIVTADPEIISHDVTGEEEFLVLACDGIWDCLSNQQVVDFVRRGIAQGKAMTEICESIMDKCLAPDSEIGGVGCDNMTFCVVGLLGGRTKQEWYDWVKQRVDGKIGWDTPEEIAPVFASQGGTGQGAEGPAVGGASGAGGGMRLGGLGGGSVLSAIAGGLQQGGHDEQQSQGIRLSGALAGA
ncbi:PP2C-domain-containing protein [Tilletiaria anomala UBC 951]|uniref:protein-serine/threonine phosphatase n=1 Tax=Tilletiaria anomala (strain ATCC 24038 / CBS 436.72 / UBC 951) TaxID=1037660 RepID=A0A066WN75_TILAU|nr:PP2C-domain-containing protein [Tilletiaria anomala UBC 951]KDN52080.1 PP2C-domain-containing protein [Tilletiaria anomala UBC 951]